MKGMTSKMIEFIIAIVIVLVILAIIILFVLSKSKGEISAFDTNILSPVINTIMGGG